MQTETWPPGKLFGEDCTVCGLSTFKCRDNCEGSKQRLAGLCNFEIEEQPEPDDFDDSTRKRR